MRIDVTNLSVLDIECDALIVNIFAEDAKHSNIIVKLNKALNDNISKFILEQPNCGNYGEVNIIPTWGAINAKRIVLIGMGKKQELTIDRLRKISAITMRYLQTLKLQTVASVLHKVDALNDLADNTQSVVEGALLGTYTFSYYKTKENDEYIKKLILVENSRETKILNKVIKTAAIIAEGVNTARDLVNHPANYMTPANMAACASKMAAEANLKVTILEKGDLENNKMGAILAVAKGSTEEPKMIVLKYNGDSQSTEKLALVGKGITFDSGGISIKSSLNMGDMKGDMAGGAAVIGAMLAIGKLQPKINIVAVIPCTENMPAGNAYRPGDIITAMNGKTIEIISTDAEGRLILADAITYAISFGATKIIDVATLTGACLVALGNVASGLITNNAELCQQLIAASKITGEKMWELPNFPEYKEQIKSDIADIKNTGGRLAGTITAGQFIEQFVDNLPWVHIDIAGTSDTKKDSGYNVKGGTGIATRTLIQLVKDMSK